MTGTKGAGGGHFIHEKVCGYIIHLFIRHRSTHLLRFLLRSVKLGVRGGRGGGA